METYCTAVLKKQAMSSPLRQKPPRATQTADPMSYRMPMLVSEVNIYWNHACYYVCPRCTSTLDREFTAYCDRCGQCLNWKQYKKAKRVFIQG